MNTSVRYLRLFLVAVPVLLATVGEAAITRQYWLGIPGEYVADLTSNPNYPDNPTGWDEPTLFEAPTDWANEYGQRMLGYVHPPESGDYTFWIASDDYSELWLSTDDDPANKLLIAQVSGWTYSRQWLRYPSQKSAEIYLEAGQKYYVEALHKEYKGQDNLAVAWEIPGESFEDVPIPGEYLSPIPEPSTLIIWSLLGALGVTVGWWRRRQRAA